MEYRNRDIIDEVSVEESDFKMTLEGDNTYGELLLTNDEFSRFVDELVKLRDEVDSLNTKEQRVDVMFDIYGGYSAEERNEVDINCHIDVYTKTTRFETKEEREKRIEEAKRVIDEEYRIENEAAVKRYDKIIGEAKELLEKAGYDVRKIHP